MRSMLGHFLRLLEEVVADPAKPIGDLDMLTRAERQQLLVEWNNTHCDYLRTLCVHQFFEAQVKRTPKATALISNGVRMSYRELDERSNRLAHYLQKMGVGPEVLVGISTDRSSDMLVGILGILKAGGAYVPLDPAYPRERLTAILEDAQASILLTQQSLLELLPQSSAQVVSLDSDWWKIELESADTVASRVKPENLAYVLFTSGSTGRPKGVALEHRSASAFMQWAQTVFTPKDVTGTLFSTSMCFDLSVFEMFVPLSLGGKLILVENAMYLPGAAAANEVTLINTVPSAMAELVASGGVPASVEVVNLAGEPLPRSLVEQIYEKTSVRKIYNLYGPTEDTTYSTYTLVEKGEAVTIGRPIANTQVYILDPNHRPVPIGVAGELYLAGEGLARGYFGQPELTSERFVRNPFSSEAGARMYRTGDLARFGADGKIQYLGRNDQQVKLRGFRIELGEIESVLAEDSGVQQAVAEVREGQGGDKHLVAYVTRVSGENPDIEELRRRLKAKLPSYMVPSTFVVLDQLPMTANGKIDRRSLPAPQPGPADRGQRVAPRDELETSLLEIFKKTLGISEEIGITDNFFDLGGHSLLAARLVSEVTRMTGTELALSALFRGASVESLAEIIRGSSPAHTEPVVLAIQQGDPRSLPIFAVASPGVEALGYALLARHLPAEQPVYKLQASAPDPGQRPFTQAELADLSRKYIAAMRRVEADGPYCFIAMCEGVQIAQQMVLDLEAEGQQVGFFAILDTWVLENSQIRWRWQINYYQQRLRELRRMSFSRRVSKLKKALGTNLRTLATFEKPELSVLWHRAYWPDKDFQPPRFQVPVVLFKRPQQPSHYIDDPELGWGRRSAGGVEIHPIDFHHREMLREPYVGLVGKLLAQHLERWRHSKAELKSLDAAAGTAALAGQRMS
ncbi:MAG: hypothetical protein DMG96_24845 [Acidobacteria bacterium]|nr:MAG: hypothetical protein DMG96_24845 [Acidobacteriota bacterium]